MTIDDVIDRFLAVWGEPKTENPAIFIAEYRRSLAGVAPDVLKAAADAAIDGEKFWPRPADMKAYINTAAVKLQHGGKGQGYTIAKRNLAELSVRRGDISWDDWMQAIGEANGERQRQHAEKIGEIRVRSRWPSRLVPIPYFDLPPEGLTDRSRQMAGEAQ